MCVAAPKIESASPPPLMSSVDPKENVAAAREADLRRRRQAMSRANTIGAGAMQGAAQTAGGKTKLGQ